MSGRLNASVEAAGLIRRTEAAGGFAMVLHKGDPERGALLIIIRSKGQYVACLERELSIDGAYRWAKTGPDDDGDSGGKLAEFLNRRTDFDPDSWLIELDIAHPERFIAETTLST